MGRSKNEMSKAEFLCFLEDVVETQYNGNRSRAAYAWGEDPIALYDVLGGRRNPTKNMLALLGFEKKTVPYFVRIKP